MKLDELRHPDIIARLLGADRFARHLHPGEGDLLAVRVFVIP